MSTSSTSPRRQSARIVASLAATLLLPALAALAPRAADAQGAAAAARAAAAERPTLVVFITVDQLRGDYHDRFASQLRGGLARLYRGAVFTNAHQDHAVTETAPGHASTLSGRFPVHTGITMNSFGVEDPQAPLVGGGGPGASPFRFRGSTLTDWMRVADPRSRALSVSRKDRGAILPLGRAHQQAFWYPGDGRFTTSSYYADTLPAWLRAFNDRRLPHAYAGHSWTPLLADSAYAEPDSGVMENRGKDFLFPHVLPADTAKAVAALAGFPWMDDLVADAALAGLQAMELGTGTQTDLLAVSFSTTDAVGHAYGPDSRELHDQILRLDVVLGRFLDSLYTLRDSSRVIVALTADHGVAPLPEVRSHDPNRNASRVEIRPLRAATDSALRARGVPAEAFVVDGGVVTMDRAAFERVGVPADSVLDAFAAAVRRLPGVLRADRWDALMQRDTAGDDIARRWRHMFPPDLAPSLVITLTPFSTFSTSTYFQHGEPHEHDTHVPVVFYGAPFLPGRHDDFVRVVDMAPTIAAVLDVQPTEPLDGRVLRAALRSAPAVGGGNR
ncbi:MAG: alkaline phosphatase family protein [Gemmatimonadaceae bacterium]